MPIYSSTGVIISIVAALVSILGAFVTWIDRIYPKAKEWFAPFDPAIIISQPIFSSSPEGELAILISLKVSNDSSVSGCIMDFALTLESHTAGWKRKFFPVFSIDMQRYVEFLELQNPLPKDRKNAFFSAVKATFGSIRLSPFSSAEQHFLFMNRPPTESAQDAIKVSELRADEYIVNFSKLVADSSCVKTLGNYENIAEFQYLLKGEQIELLVEGGHVTPLDKNLDKAREKEASRR